MQHNTIQNETTLYNTIQYNTIQYNAIQYTNSVYVDNVGKVALIPEPGLMLKTFSRGGCIANFGWPFLQSIKFRIHCLADVIPSKFTILLQVIDIKQTDQVYDQNIKIYTQFQTKM